MSEQRVRVDKRRLDALMGLRGIDNKTLATMLDTHYNTILRIKEEQSTTLARLEQLCDALECHPFDLLVAEGFPEPFLAAPVSL
jgi:DNA-binding Xre family transcriptional regulator